MNDGGRFAGVRVLVDIVHPAHVHFYRGMIRSLVDGGAEVRVASRDKDVTVELLDQFGIPHVVVGAATARSRTAQARELLSRDVALVRMARAFRPHVVLSRNPSGMQAARLVGAKGIFDTDDGRAAGIHFRLAAPFAHVITTPTAIDDDYGPRHRRYESYKALAYLHPQRFTPDPTMREAIGVGEGDNLALVRLVAMNASHDHHESGFSPTLLTELLERLRAWGTLRISSEAPLPAELEPYRLSIPSSRMHDLLATADVLVCDSQTMAAEAAIVGTPVVHASSFSGRLGYLVELVETYGLIESFLPSDTAAVLDALDRVLGDVDAAAERQIEARDRMLADKIDLTGWYLDLIEEVVGPV